MSKYLLFILIFFSGFFSFGQKNVSENLQKILKYNLKEEYKIWIFFNDKQKDISENIYNFTDIPVTQEYINKIKSQVIEIKQVSNWLNAVSVISGRQQIEIIAKYNFVKKIDIVRKLEKTEISPYKNIFPPQAVQTFGIDSIDYGQSYTQLVSLQVPEIHKLGFSAKGVKIAVMDSGFDNLDHEVFQNLNILATYDFVNKHERVSTSDGDLGTGTHGNAVLSTIAGFKKGSLIGPAYGATYILSKTENTASETTVEEDNWVAAAEWAAGLGAEIFSTSLGYIWFEDDTTGYYGKLDGNTSVMTIASDIAASKGILVINGIGNSGPFESSLLAPADGDSVLAVGATKISGKLEMFSSKGPTADGRIKPDVVAQGSDIYVAIIDNGYEYTQGTSFSCPLVAGCAGLLMEMVPTATSSEIFDALKYTADNADNPNNEYGWGMVKTYQAYKYLIGALSVNETQKSTNVKIYPNPSYDFLIVRNNIFGESRLTITDIFGKEFFKANFKTKIKINISDFNKGVYFINVFTKNEKSVLKFIKI